MQGVTSRETHFQCVAGFPHNPQYIISAQPYGSNHLGADFFVSVTITSAAFDSKMQPARHRMVYALLKEEMDREEGIHALQLKTKTPTEEEREKGMEKEA